MQLLRRYANPHCPRNNNTAVYLLVFPPPPAIINSEFIRPDEPRLPKLDADMDGNPPAFPWPAHLLFWWLAPVPCSGAPPAEDCDGGASSFLRICSSSRACMSICNRSNNYYRFGLPACIFNFLNPNNVFDYYCVTVRKSRRYDYNINTDLPLFQLLAQFDLLAYGLH